MQEKIKKYYILYNLLVQASNIKEYKFQITL